MGKENCFLSKCRYLNGVKCLKLAWYECNAQFLIPKPDAQTQAVFDWGHFIGDKAKEYFPDGEENLESDFKAHLQKSRDWLTRQIPLFEVAYMSNDNLYARPDVLRPAKNGAWDIVEVKCNTEIHEVNVRDIAYQQYVLTAAGLTIDRLILMHPRPEVRVKRDTPSEEIFMLEDVTERAKEYLPTIHDNVLKIRKACADDCCLWEIKMGEQCEKPYKCPLFDVCKQDEMNSGVADYPSYEEMCAEEKMEAAKDSSDFIRIATECVVDGIEHMAIQSLQKAEELARFSTDFCEIATAYLEYDLKKNDVIERCISEAEKLAKLKVEFDEIEELKAFYLRKKDDR